MRDESASLMDDIIDSLNGRSPSWLSRRPPPSVALNSSGGSGEVQTTTLRGLKFIRKDGWVCVSGKYITSSSSSKIPPAFRPATTVYYSVSDGDDLTRVNAALYIDSDGSVDIEDDRFDGIYIINPFVYPAGEA